MRVHGLSSGEAGTVLALLSAAFSALGIYAGGRLADTLGARDVRWYMHVPALASFAYAPLALLFLLAPGLPIALACLVPASFLVGVSVPGMHAVTQELAKPAMRSFAAAINLLMLSLIGTGLGPTIAGILNDAFAGSGAGEPIRYSLSIVAITAVWSGVHKWLSGRALPGELPPRART